MKRLLFHLACLALFMALVLPAHAQRLVPKRQSLELTASLPIIKGEKLFSQDNFGIGLSLTRYLKQGRYTFLSVDYDQQTMPYHTGGVRLQDALLHLGYMQPILSDRGKNVLLYLGLSALGGYEELNEEQSLLPDGATLLNRSRFVYGAGMHSSIEVFLTDNLLFTLKAQGRILFGSDLHPLRPALSAGLKFTI